MKLRLANAAILAYRRLPYKAWYAIAEFVDNSTDAYLREDNRKILDESFKQSGENLKVEVTYDRNQGILRIADNSMGMNEAELDSAMIIGEKPEVSAGRSEFGMGMKTAAIWLADTIEIRTKKIGEDFEYRVKIDIQDYVKGVEDFEIHKTSKPKDKHYTIIELSNLQRRFGATQIRKTNEFLGSIYRMDLRDGTMSLSVNGTPITPPTSSEDDRFLKRSDDTPYVIQLEGIEVNGKRVTGWIGILRSGFSGRSNAGLALIRHNRTIRGWLDSWRPEEIFGDARNDTLNQRIVGELFMDDFRASHTKDAIDWEDDDESVLGEKIKEFADQHDLLRQAKKRFKNDPDHDPEAEREKVEAQSALEHQLTSRKMQDVIRILDVPTPEVAVIAAEVLLEATESEMPVVEWNLSNGKKAKLYEIKLSPNDPYYEYEITSDFDLRIVINASHPAMDLLNSAESRLTHYHHVTLDAISEWTCAQQSEPIVSESIRLMKDRLFRTVSESTED